ncbi:MAG TPA: HNH endonuclease signature motif containing protein [Burkholderiales bacterium]|nr:HNH endonuclease signature motif containing protein [Burkholderiales bacterium]
MRRYLLVFVVCLTWWSVADARSPTARHAFVKANPCPVTGKARGACPGYQVDHIAPLKCGGADSFENMQWLTVEAHKAKTKAEASWCRRKND